MTGETIAWNEARLKQLEDAFKEASSKPHKPNDRLLVQIAGRAKPYGVRMDYARYLVSSLKAEFTANAPQTYPENREGKEGQ